MQIRWGSARIRAAADSESRVSTLGGSDKARLMAAAGRPGQGARKTFPIVVRLDDSVLLFPAFCIQQRPVHCLSKRSAAISRLRNKRRRPPSSGHCARPALGPPCPFSQHRTTQAAPSLENQPIPTARLLQLSTHDGIRAPSPATRPFLHSCRCEAGPFVPIPSPEQRPLSAVGRPLAGSSCTW